MKIRHWWKKNTFGAKTIAVTRYRGKPYRYLANRERFETRHCNVPSSLTSSQFVNDIPSDRTFISGVIYKSTENTSGLLYPETDLSMRTWRKDAPSGSQVSEVPVSHWYSPLRGLSGSLERQEKQVAAQGYQSCRRPVSTPIYKTSAHSRNLNNYEDYNKVRQAPRVLLFRDVLSTANAKMCIAQTGR